jgi:hypothetical protein
LGNVASILELDENLQKYYKVFEAAPVVLFILLYVILQSMSNNNLQNELPSTIYPSMPHLGLDGISLNNYVSGLTPKSYV